MAKFCGNCGANLEEAVSFCPNCGQKLNTAVGVTKNTQHIEKNVPADINTQIKESEKPAKKSEKKEKKKKHILLRVIAILLCLVIISGGALFALSYFDIIAIPVITNFIDTFTKRTPQEKYAAEIVDAFKQGDMSTINNIIFHNNLYYINDSDTTSFSNNGVLKSLFLETQLSLIKVESGHFIYKINAPDMRGVFDDVSAIETEDELRAHIEQFAKNAKKRTETVSVEFSEIDGKFTANYKSEEFINAITGGLVDEYKTLFTQYMNELMSKE